MLGKALIIMASPRKNGNTVWLTSRVYESLRQRKVDVNLSDVSRLHCVNNGCIACYACQKSKEYLCVFKDDISALTATLPLYEFIIFATPIFFYSPPAQIKLVIDRMFSLLKIDASGNYIHPFSKRTRFGLIATCGDDKESGFRATNETFRQIAELFGVPLKMLQMPLTTANAADITEPERWQKLAEEFCDDLIGQH